MWSIVRVAVGAAIIGLAAACGSSTEAVLPPAGCVGDITVTVTNTNTATPTVSWSPACGENRLSVEVVDGVTGQTSSYWAISSQTTFGPGVKYGTVPSGAESLVPTLALKAGQTYQVFVGRAGGEAALLSQGRTTFLAEFSKD